MTTKMIKTSHYITHAAREDVQRLAKHHARSAGWIVRKCVEYALAHATDIDFQGTTRALQTDPEFKQALQDFFGDQPT